MEIGESERKKITFRKMLFGVKITRDLLFYKVFVANAKTKQTALTTCSESELKETQITLIKSLCHT